MVLRRGDVLQKTDRWPLHGARHAPHSAVCMGGVSIHRVPGSASEERGASLPLDIAIEISEVELKVGRTSFMSMPSQRAVVSCHGWELY
jgi:hypothetical protein